MSSTVLCMIVKNEEKLLNDTLKSIIDEVGLAIICDTGSTDGTLAVLQNSGQKVITISSEFKRFDTNRNEVFEYVYKLDDSSRYKQILWLDAGDIFHGKIPTIPENVEALSCLKTTHTAEGGGSQQTIRLTRNNGKFFYKYPVHEQLYHLDVDTNFKCKYTDKFSIIQNRDADEEQKTTNRAEWDIKQLEMHPEDIMCTFHLGQVYQRLGKSDKSIEAYQKCITLVRGKSHADNELLFQCYLRIAGLTTDNVLKVGNWTLSYTTSGRIEGLYDYASWLYENNRLMLAYAISVVCIMAERPTNEQFMLGIDTDLYLYKRYAFHATLCKLMNRKEECIENIKLALQYVDPDVDIDKIAYCRELMTEPVGEH